MRAKSWVKELQRQASPNIVIALSGNKADLAGKRMVDYDVRVREGGREGGRERGRERERLRRRR